MATVVLAKRVSFENLSNISGSFAFSNRLHFLVGFLLGRGIVNTATSIKALKHCGKPDFAVDLCHTLEIGLSNAFRTEDDVLMNSNISADRDVMSMVSDVLLTISSSVSRFVSGTCDTHVSVLLLPIICGRGREGSTYKEPDKPGA